MGHRILLNREHHLIPHPLIHLKYLILSQSGATENFVQHFGNESHCRDVNGTSFDTKAAATKEHHRLKSAFASTELRPDYELTIELEFWKSVKDSEDPDMLQAYLDKYPNGKFSLLAKIKIKKLRFPGSND